MWYAGAEWTFANTLDLFTERAVMYGSVRDKGTMGR